MVSVYCVSSYLLLHVVWFMFLWQVVFLPFIFVFDRGDPLSNSEVFFACKEDAMEFCRKNGMVALCATFLLILLY